MFISITHLNIPDTSYMQLIGRRQKSVIVTITDLHQDVCSSSSQGATPAASGHWYPACCRESTRGGALQWVCRVAAEYLQEICSAAGYLQVFSCEVCVISSKLHAGIFKRSSSRSEDKQENCRHRRV